MKNIAVFVSGSGSDMQSIIDAVENGKINGKIVAVIANKEGIFALERAEKHNIPSMVFKVKDYGSIEERDKAILNYLKPLNVDLIVLAGYLSIVTPILVDAYNKKIINIHPSLIPLHCGKGMYGLKVHQSVLASKDKVSGATVHYVDYGADTGEIIKNIKVDVLDDDTPESLQKRVLEKEHILLPEVVAMLCEK